MEVRRFVGPTKDQCLQRVRSELGDSAVILSTRTVQQKWFLGLLKRDQIEVTAGRGVRIMPRRSGSRRPSAPGQQARALIDAAAGPLAGGSAAPATRQPGRDLLGTPAAMTAVYLGLSGEIDVLKKMILDTLNQVRHSQPTDIPQPFIDLYSTLRKQEVDKLVARQIILAAAASGVDGGEALSPQHLRKLVCCEIEKRLRICGPVKPKSGDRPRVVALIGPTGVGKTTTIAKLAANLKLREGKQVGLITIDTYRIAAIDQLKKYAQIISAPLCVVSHPGEIRDAIRKMAGLDFVLIDTAGRSPKDAVKLKELQSFLDAARPDEVHLVLSSVCGTPSTLLALEQFSDVRADRLIFTKLDETVSVGLVLNVAGLTNLPVSYLTNGQDVPNDIDVASARKLALLVTEPPSRATNAA